MDASCHQRTHAPQQIACTVVIEEPPQKPYLLTIASSWARQLCRARASQCEGVLAWERARREFQPRLPAAIFVDERELPVCLRGLRQSYSDRFLLAQIAHRQLSVLPGEMLICAARKGLIVTFEMVDDHGVVEEKLPMAGTADETDQGGQQRYRATLHPAAIRPCFSAPYFRRQWSTQG